MAAKAGLVSGIVWVSFAMLASAATGNDSDKARVVAAVEPLGVKADDVKVSPAEGLFEISANGRVAYVTADGKYLLRGDMIDIATRANVTEARRDAARKDALAHLDESQMIIFSPEHPKHTVTVFTDVDCSYCRKMHGEMAKYNELGIRVRYAAYPRSGPKSEDWTKMEAVWCSKDRRDAITRAKRGEAVDAHCDAPSPIESQYDLGSRLGMTGTPGVFTEDGKLVGGYVPPAQLLALIEKGQ
jgi:thiol:disulfide interchange protein DsbC